MHGAIFLFVVLGKQRQVYFHRRLLLSLRAVDEILAIFPGVVDDTGVVDIVVPLLPACLPGPCGCAPVDPFFATAPSSCIPHATFLSIEVGVEV